MIKSKSYVIEFNLFRISDHHLFAGNRDLHQGTFQRTSFAVLQAAVPPVLQLRPGVGGMTCSPYVRWPRRRCRRPFSMMWAISGPSEAERPQKDCVMAP